MLPSCCVVVSHNSDKILARSCHISCDVMALEIHSADVTRLCVGKEENPCSRAITENDGTCSSV
jgi:hypothetical protein